MDKIDLSEREAQILNLASRGMTDKEIGGELGLSRSTLNTYWFRIRMKTGATTRSEMVAKVIRRRAKERLEEKESENLQLQEEIEKRKRVEETLRQREQQLQAIIDATTSVMYVKDLEGRHILSNRAFLEGIGLPREEVLGKSDRDLFGEAAVVISENDRTVRRERKAMQFEERVHWRGRLRTFVSSKAPMVDEQGRVVGLCGISTDITEQKDAEVELRRSQQTVQAILAGTPATVWIKGRDRRFQLANQRMCDLMGRTREEILGKTDVELLGQEVADRLWELDQRVIDTKQAVTGEEWAFLDGRHRVSVSSKVPLFDDHGEVTAICGIAIDITEMRAAESARRDSDARLQLLLEATPAFIRILDSEMRYVEVNQRFADLVGLPRDEILGLSELSTVNAEATASARAATMRVLRSGLPQTSIERAVIQGRRVDAMTVRVPMFDESGAVVGVCASSLDITDQIQLQERLTSAQETAEVMSHGRRLGLWSYERDRDHCYVDDTVRQMLGYRLEELPNPVAEWRDLCSPEDAATIEALVASDGEPGESWIDSTYRLRARNGEPVPVLVWAKVVRDEQGHHVRTVGAVLDTRGLQV